MSSRRSGDLDKVDLQAVVRSLFLERATGVLEVAVDGGRRRLFFVDGELYLPPTNLMAKQLARELGQGEASAASRDLMERMAGVIGGWREGTFTFDPGRAAVPPEAVGPLPTAALVMAGAVMDRDEGELLAQLGGEEATLVACPLDDPRLGPAQPDRGEVELLKALQAPRKVGQALAATALERRAALEGLCRLRALGVVEPPPEPMVEDRLLSPELLQELGRRVALDLASRPVELGTQAHRSRLADLLGRLGEMSHYQLLGVEPDASSEEIHVAYSELARLVHPLHAARLGLKGREEAIRLLFERATEAYLTLSDPQRRMRYDRETGASSGGAADSANRSQEARRLAQQYFHEAQDMVDREEYHYALELLRQAVQADPRPEYHALMAEVQQRNPKWLHHAVDSYRKALQGQPGNTAWRLAMGELFELLDDRERARATYRSILARQADHPQARAGLRRLEGRREGGEGGLLAWLFGRRTR